MRTYAKESVFSQVAIQVDESKFLHSYSSLPFSAAAPLVEYSHYDIGKSPTVSE